MKKTMSLIAASAIAISSFAATAVCADASFSDINSEHWAYESVSRLVSAGTINGYDDGTFLPDATVTRAEFVKMIGKSDIKRNTDFSDVAQNHWAYDYIIYSGLGGDENNNFNPDVPITRNDVAQLLYTRYAGGADSVAPYPVTSSGTSAKAASWVYNQGLMLGDDMINLRLGDSLTRAEAAVLIVRAQNLDLSQKRNFIDNFSDEVYEKIYTSSELFDTPYKADETITNGEIARAAMRFEYKEKKPLYAHYNYTTEFKGTYSDDWAIMLQYALDNGKLANTEADCNKNAKVADAIAMISQGARNNNYYRAMIDTDNNAVYPELNLSDSSSNYYRNLSYAYNYGISLYADAKINPDKEITKKELACIIMQYDMGMGANIAYRCGYECTYVPTPIRFETAYYPSNADDYSVILQDIPNVVYETPFNNLKGNITDFTSGGKSIATVFASPLTDLSYIAYSKGINVYITYYPTIAANTNNGYVYRVKFEIEDTPDGMKLSDIINLGNGTEDFALVKGDEFYVDVCTNSYLNGIYLDYQICTADRVIRG